MQKQVDKSHYDFGTYVHKRRWASMWHQLDEVIKLKPERVLEIGPGPGLFKAVAGALGVDVETLDLDPELAPDHIAPADDMPFYDGAFDVVCAFQMLEHVPYDTSVTVFREMARVAARRVVISLPDARPAWPYSFHIPSKGDFKFHFVRPWLGPKEHCFDGEHYWEVNKKGYARRKIIRDFEKSASVVLIKTFSVKENPYHRFFVFSTNGKSAT